MKHSIKIFTCIYFLTNHFLKTKSEFSSFQGYKVIDSKDNVFLTSNNISIYDYNQKKGKVIKSIIKSIYKLIN